MSRPQTPSGVSPRSSYLNLGDINSASSTPTSAQGANIGEKERLKAEAEAAQLMAADGTEKAKKEDTGMPGTSPLWPIAAYCFASIMITVVNKFVVSGHQFTMTFLLLTIQSVVCVAYVYAAKKMGLISSISIYTGVHNLTIILIVNLKPTYPSSISDHCIQAYGEVIWFGGSVTGLTLVSFALMVGSSVIAAWSDISTTLARISAGVAVLDPTTGIDVPLPVGVIGRLNAGYGWMFINSVTSAAYVLAMRKRIKVTGFRDWDSMFYNNLLSIPVLFVFSFLVEDWGAEGFARNFPEAQRNFLLLAIVFSGAAAVFISYSTAWLPVAASGILFFGDPVYLGNVSAIGVGGFAGVVYAVAKINASRIEKAKQARIAEKGFGKA
ncbi:GDP-mannose transporter, partial [Tremellales sp. Uapishka_1]